METTISDGAIEGWRERTMAYLFGSLTNSYINDTGWRCDRLSRSTPCADQEFFSPAMLQVPITVHFDHGSWREELMEVLELAMWAQEFIDETGIDAEAVCIGNVHGEYPASGPKHRLDLLKDLYDVASKNGVFIEPPDCLRTGPGTYISL
ncbi:hypothetical protein L2E82_43044 [Cichorium intybus]|uniref:Uncharacterized protein n=1 Tax=Cichorium intybus TaxID=13427 RepID=A0ACB8ZMK8_CICIN|nr:hypothetical protein L2E82_43044 [Cichorium intybus]